MLVKTIRKISPNKINSLLFILLVLVSSACALHTKQQSGGHYADTNPDQQDIDAEYVDQTPTDLEEGIEHEIDSQDILSYEKSKKTFPLVHNEYVQVWIDYFTGRGRRTMEKWLSRSTRYIPIIKKVLQEDGLPEDLIYLSMIESGFNPRAYSHAAAVGPWQFIKGTGTRYGLKVNYWIDERKDIVKSTHAAARYLKELYLVFGSWYLAAAGYNAGEGRVINAIRRDRSRNFWELIQNKDNFRAETRNYVPKIIAAALISKHPEKYGFTKSIPYEKPLTWESVRVPGGVDLRAVAKLTGVTHSKIKLLNSELRIGITPPDSKNGYLLKIPPVKKQLLASKVKQLKSMQINYFVNHKLRRGENLGYIARRYKTKVSTLMQLNAIRNARRLQIGQVIKVPLPGSRVKKGASSKSVARASGDVHVVKRGETLSEIAGAYKTSSRTLMRLNNIRSARRLKAGTRLRLPASVSKKSSPQYHIVKRGETLGKIASLYKTSVRYLMKLNGIKNSRSLQAGARLKLKEKSQNTSSQSKYIRHKVRKGENLSSIAKKYKTSISTLKKINRIQNSRLIKIGQNLKVPNPYSLPGI